ncbi:mechanosensitive ion channel [Terrilactibacillus sp. BCM23-1]|uniref:Mechanosensitive ion channel n=1 Tax=Terrilactibacillus tamarindi TaxID=2599694 RepID=A0A6N8CUN5_9BACI|nr:mechanosensitive ion channel family protein [Terrilactibacillus tamarindi]MTT33067.1 mechanosensitive ion channel [Terrilactibacillus tamarindi]
MTIIKAFEWVKNITFYDGAIALIIFVLFFILRKLFSKYFLKLLTKIIGHMNHKVDRTFIISFQRPIQFFLAVTGLYFALMYLPLPREWKHVFSLLYRSTIIFCIGWGFYVFSNMLSYLFGEMGNRLDLKFNEIVIPFFAKIIKFLVIVLTAAAILGLWGYQLGGLITGLGIGGLAVALAAKDTLSNLFGGLVIITESPFTLGDTIQSGTIIGTVEDINFRSTKIRTPEQALVTVPNSTLASQAIINTSRMEKKRNQFDVLIAIDTPLEKVTRAIDLIRDMLDHRDDLDKASNAVYFTEFTTHGYKLNVTFFTLTTDVNEASRIREACNIAILDILESENVKLSIPLQRIMNNGDPLRIEDPMNSRTSEQKRNQTRSQ